MNACFIPINRQCGFSTPPKGKPDEESDSTAPVTPDPSLATSTSSSGDGQTVFRVVPSMKSNNANKEKGNVEVEILLDDRQNFVQETEKHTQIISRSVNSCRHIKSRQQEDMSSPILVSPESLSRDEEIYTLGDKSTTEGQTGCSFNCLSDSFSDVLAHIDCQEYLLQELHYLLGWTMMPCCRKGKERNLFDSCFNPFLLWEKTEEESMIFNKKGIRNRAAEGSHAIICRIQKLREERSMCTSSDGRGHASSDHVLVSGRLGIGQSSYENSRTMMGETSRQLSVISSRSMDDTVVESRQYTGGEYRVQSKHAQPPQSNFDNVQNDAYGCMIGECIEPISFATGDGDLELVYNDMRNREPEMEEIDMCYDSDPGANTTSLFFVGKDGEIERSECLHQRTKSTPLFVIEGRDVPFNGNKGMYFDSLFEDDDDEDDDDNEIHKEHCRREKNELSHSSPKCQLSEFVSQEVETIGDISDDNDDGVGDIMENGCSLWRGRDDSPGKKDVNVSDVIHGQIQEALNETWTLTWHPTTLDVSSDSASDRAQKRAHKTPSRMYSSSHGSISSTKNEVTGPILSQRCIKLWFERGNRIRRNDIVEPKIMWRDAYHPDLVSKRKLNVSSTERPYQICLLSICRILEATHVDRAKYPFAKKSCSYFIRTCEDEEFLFEAVSEQERNRIVHIWKLVVARLASQAVVGNGEGMLGEFFVPSGFAVP